MSETVQLALIAMMQSAINSLFANLSGIVTAAAAGIIAFLTWRNNVKMAARAEEIKAGLAAVKSAAVLSSEQAEDIATGRERKGYVSGIEKERNRSSRPAPLTSDFQPQQTDAWIAGKPP